jgi:hypothetical protein
LEDGEWVALFLDYLMFLGFRKNVFVYVVVGSAH